MAWRWLALLIIAGAGGAALWPNPHAWQPLGAGVGRIRWVRTSTEVLAEHPMAAPWIRGLHRAGLPWPTDLPLEPLGPSFGGQGDTAAAWYLVQSARPSLELWNLDKDSARVLAPAGGVEPFRGSTGSALVNERRRTQFLYLGVPAEQAGKGYRLQFRLVRYERTAATRQETRIVVVPF